MQPKHSFVVSFETKIIISKNFLAINYLFSGNNLSRIRSD